MSDVRAIVHFGCCAILLSLPLGAATCDSLVSLKLGDAAVSAAQVVAAGAFVPPASALGPLASPAMFKSLPEFCRVQGVIEPTNDSHIEFEVWLPTSGWNGKYMGVGNGGLAGSISYVGVPNTPGLSDAVLAGFAVSSTDTGHKAAGDDAGWVAGHPEKVVDYGYRAIHETAEKSKAIIRAFYGDGPKYSYFSSCSNGGRQALMEAQRFPADYNGIIAAAPGYSFSRLFPAWIVGYQATEVDPASYIPAAKLPAIESAALAACDALDGLRDGLIDDPRKCHFDPMMLLCWGAESSSCLTQPQAVALKKIYSGVRTSKGEQIYPGLLPGGETGLAGWGVFVTGTGPGKSALFTLATKAGGQLLFHNPAWDYRSFNPDSDIRITTEAARQSLDATDPNLKAFEDRSGKLILFQGWSDAAVPPTGTIDYFESVTAKMGRKDAASFTRLYMVPGMQHCAGGPGPNTFGDQITTALGHWVEQGSAPDRIIATKYKTDFNPSSGVARTRPLCPYPQVARYTGSGSIDDAANFVCRMP